MDTIATLSSLLAGLPEESREEMIRLMQSATAKKAAVEAHAPVAHNVHQDGPHGDPYPPVDPPGPLPPIEAPSHDPALPSRVPLQQVQIDPSLESASANLPRAEEAHIPIPNAPLASQNAAPPQSPRRRSRPAPQGTLREQRRRRTQRERAGNDADDEADEMEDAANEIVAEDDARPDLCKIRRNSPLWNTDVLAARTVIFRDIAVEMRNLCGVFKKDPWPLRTVTTTMRTCPQTGESFFNPNFDAGRTHGSCVVLLKRVSEVVFAEYKRIDDDLPSFLKRKHPVYRVSKDTIYELAKTTFDRFRSAYRADQDPAAAANKIRNDRNTRRSSRKIHKANRLLKIVPEYIEAYGVDPTPLINVEFLSAEESSPESGTDETPEEWKLRMAEFGNLSTHPDQLERTQIFEVTKSPWRSAECNEVMLQLRYMHWGSLSIREKLKFGTRLYTDREDMRIPLIAPWDFSVDSEWYEARKDDETYYEYLQTWLTHGDPPGFGRNAPAPAPSAAAAPSSPTPPTAPNEQVHEEEES